MGIGCGLALAVSQVLEPFARAGYTRDSSGSVTRYHRRRFVYLPPLEVVVTKSPSSLLCTVSPETGPKEGRRAFYTLLAELPLFRQNGATQTLFHGP